MLYQNSAEAENLTNVSDSLIARAKTGDDEAFGMIFELHHRFIFRFVYAMIGEQSLAEELTQETFLAAYKGISSMRGEAKLQTWLCAIAKNLVGRHYRSNQKESGKIEVEIETMQIEDKTNFPPDKKILNRELNALIKTALEKLDEDKRLVFVLKELQKMSYREISEITKHKIPKLKTDLRRAKIEMRKTIQPYLEASDEL